MLAATLFRPSCNFSREIVKRIPDPLVSGVPWRTGQK
jgi:hypothetical protein